MSWWRGSIKGLAPIESRIDLQLLQDSWRITPSSVLSQIPALLLLIWMVKDSPLPRWHWAAPAVGLMLVWAVVGLMTQRFQRFGIAASGYRTWRAALVGWHLLQSIFWGLMGVALLSVATSSWKMSLVAAVVVYGYTLMLVLVHDWIVGFFGSFPLLMLVSLRLLVDQEDSSVYLAVVLMLSMITCMFISSGISRRLREGALLRHENAALVLQLRHEINQVTLAKALAEGADRQKGEFFAAASHDLRQPLHVMMLLTSALTPWVPQAEGQDLLSKISTSLKSLSTLFERMFDVASIDAERVEHQPQALALSTLYRRLDHEFAVLCTNKGLSWQVDATDAWVQADPHLTERILRNLLNNAVRYTPQGHVRLRARVRGRWVVCQVWDSGVGVAREHRERIFDDYFQAHNTSRRSGEGLGLGLAVVRRLARLGRVQVTVRSRLGRGSCFSLRLPLREAIVTPQPPALPNGADHAERKDPRQRGVVVVIDDEPQVLDSMALVLRQNGWQAATGTTPQVAVEAVAALQTTGDMPLGDLPVAVISDYRLGLTITGLEAIAQLRYEFGEDLPAFLLTADATSDLGSRAASVGVTLLRKPLNPNELVRILNAA
ncbi:MAG: response regulator [Rubrivivax sp.]|nr:MAG: response regulator [Rubrivivax sp.]